MEPVLQRLGDVTIQRLEKPKEPKVGPQNDSSSLEKPKEGKEEASSGPEDYSGDESLPGLKRTLPLALPSSSELSVKRFKYDSGDISFEKKCDDLSVNNFSETEMSDYDSESEIESENELNENELSDINKPIIPKEEEEDVEDEASSSTSFFEKLVEQAEITSTPTVTPKTSESSAQDEDYEVDIKEKLKEMGEISFGTVKKGEKPKKAELSTENEVVITPARKPGVSDEDLANQPKANLRRNIREVMDETKLDEATLAAQRQEAERLRRVQEQQRLLRELQRQAQQERMQHKVMSLLQGNNFSKPGPSNQTRIGNTVLVKLPNGQTKPMTKLPKHPFELLRVPKNASSSMSSPPTPMGAPQGHPRSLMQQKKPGTHLTPSVSIAPVAKKMQPPPPRHHSDSDSEGEDRKPFMSPMMRKKGKDSVPTIDISSDDDCIVVSEPEGDPGNDECDQDDPSNSGMHTNDEFNQPDEQGRVLVNVAHADDEPDVFVAPQISQIIKPHQIGGVRFLYDNIIESINRFATSTGFGCILAHSMGLGKTLQIVTFSDIFLRYTPAKTILCIMPINTLQNWMAEYNMWLPSEEVAANSPLHGHGEMRPRNFNLHVLNDSHKTLVARSKVIHAWRTNGGVLLIGYEQYRLLSMRKHPKSRRKPIQAEIPDDDKNKMLFDEVHEALVNPGPDLVICDEGHRIKNSHASISLALKQMRTKRRVVLTGYPLQNNLMEYWCMVDFVRPNYLGTKTEFCNMFERPIMNGQCIDSTEADIKLMRYRAHVLHSLLVGFVQRRSHKVLHSALPQKEEYVLLVRMTPFQRKLYDTFMNEVVRTQAVPNPLKAFAVCCKIWNHPDVLYNFLKKRAGGDAVDIDLEEVGTAVTPSTSTTPETKPKRAPARPRKSAPKGKNGKPAASVTPYNSSTEANLSPMQPPGTNTQANNSQPNTTPSVSNSGQITSFSNTISSQNSREPSQPRTSFQGISEVFEENPYYNTHFDQNAQFPSNFSNSSNNFSQSYQSNSPSPSTNYNNMPSSSSFNQPQQPQSNNRTNFLHLDSQTNQSSVSFAGLSSEISLTPLSSKTQTPGPLTSVSATNVTTNSPMSAQNSTLMEIGGTCTQNTYNQNNRFNPSQQSSQNNQFNQNQPSNQNNQFSQSQPNTENNQFNQNQTSNQNNQFNQNQASPSQYPAQANDYNNFQQNNYQENYNQQNYWTPPEQQQPQPPHEPDFNQPNFFNENNQFNPNFSSSNANHPWIKKEEASPKPSIISNHLISPVKSETSNDSKPKIKIISDIKLPPVFNSNPDRKINIISDIKIEPKKEEIDDKYGMKQEIEKIKNEIKNELKIEDDIKPFNESPLNKLSSLMPLKESKEDSGIPYDWAIELLKEYVPGRIENSAKMEILFCIIRESITLGDRLLVFSQSLITLDLIEQFLQMSVVPGDAVKWARNTSYYRLDGSTSALEREKLINEFNSNPKIHLFLVSTRAGSLGINLIGANRVVVLDASWNPCHDTQAVCRVYRYGQRKPCFVYRLVVDNCLEKKIYDRQVSKQGMSDRVVDECNPDAHLTIKDVSTLCFDDKKEEGEIKDWSHYKDNYIDVVLQIVLDRHSKTLNKEPFQHESLLVDRKEKQLSQQEKRLAKKGYEREKQASRQPAYGLLGSGRGHRPVASVRPMQQGERPSRWIPAEHWQRQGMTAQEMTLPLDVVIPTNQPEKGNIVLKAGQKVLVLKSPKGVYMQLESGKIVAIKTAIKVKGKAEDNHDPMKMAKPLLPPQMKNNPSLSVIPQKRVVKPFTPGVAKLNVRSVRQNVPNLVSRIQSVTKKVQMAKTKPYNVGSEIAKSLQKDSLKGFPGSSSDDEHMAERPKPPVESADELQKRISMLKKNISIQRVSSQPGKGQPQQPKEPPKPAQTVMQQVQAQQKMRQEASALERLEQSTSSALDENTPFQETLDSITSGFKSNDLEHLEEEEEDEPEEEEEEEEEEEPISDSSLTEQQNKSQEPNESISDHSDEVTYVSEQPAPPNQYPTNSDPQTKESQPDFNSSYNNYYNYNIPPYQAPPPPQGYNYPPQHPPPYDMLGGYPPQSGQPPYNYGYQGYPPPQPHYPPPPPQPGYDYSNPPPPQPIYGAYNPYPQPYPPPPQGIYPPQPGPAPATPYPDYSQYPNNAAPPAAPFYPNT